MFRRSNLLIFLLIIPLFISCRSLRTGTYAKTSDADVQAYINRYSNLAVSEMKRTGIPASITLAQGMIESDFGRSTLAREGNNHFGIKCHDDWTGPAIRHNDDRRNECFRKYSRPEDSFYDHSDFLRSGSRYQDLFNLSQTDYKAWAHGLRRDGYATNPDYANMLIRNIEENNLYYFDSDRQLPPQVQTIPQAQNIPQNQIVQETQTFGQIERAADSSDLRQEQTVQQQVIQNNEINTTSGSRVMENNRILYIIVQEGETAETINHEFKLMKWELSRYNELSDTFTPYSGQMLYLQPKREKAEPGKETHLVRNGDSMYSISQIYGVKLKKLYEYNRLEENYEPVPGDKIWLRGMKPVN